MSWWIDLGYHPFEEGKNGRPRTGQVVQYYREQKKDDKGKVYTQKELARILGIKWRAMWDIEKKDTEMSMERREFLCDLLGIPPELLGFATLADIAKRIEEKKGGSQSGGGNIFISSSPRSSDIDIGEYQEYLTSCLNRTSVENLPKLHQRMDTLYRELPHARDSKRRTDLTQLLCEYHGFTGSALIDQQAYTVALEHHERMLDLAEALQDEQLIVLALHGQGRVYCHANYIPETVITYDRIMPHIQKMPDALRFAILQGASIAYARNYALTGDTRESTRAIALVDQAGRIVRTNPHADNSHYTDFSITRYHITHGDVLIKIGHNRDGIRELSSVVDDPQSGRSAFNTILQAQGYLNLGKFPMAASYAEAGLVVVQRINSRVNIARIEHIQQQLKASSYKNNPDVARLEHLLKFGS